jgi:hypothetical protein
MLRLVLGHMMLASVLIGAHALKAAGYGHDADPIAIADQAIMGS